MKREANFQTTFSHWLKSVHKKTGAFELKQTKTNSIAFDSVVPHQEAALLNSSQNVLAYKIPDVGYQNPFDCICLADIPAYVVIKYPKFFCLILIEDWVAEKKRSLRRSLTSERAREIAMKIVE